MVDLVNTFGDFDLAHLRSEGDDREDKSLVMPPREH